MYIKKIFDELELTYYKYCHERSLIFAENKSSFATMELLTISNHLDLNKIKYQVNSDYSISILLD